MGSYTPTRQRTDNRTASIVIAVVLGIALVALACAVTCPAIIAAIQAAATTATVGASSGAGATTLAVGKAIGEGLTDQPSAAGIATNSGAGAVRAVGAVPDPKPAFRLNGAPDRSSPWYVGYRDAGGNVQTVGNLDGVHAEARIQQMLPGASMSRPFGWRTLDSSVGPQWVEGAVCQGCQVYSRNLFPSGTEELQVDLGATEFMRPLSERVIEEVDWSTFDVAGGPATMLGTALRDLLVSSDLDEASAAWNEIEEHVFSQGTIYSAAEPTVSVVLAALTEDQPSWRSGRLLDLLFFLVSGISVTDSSLQARCRERAREGYWLLARWALAHEGWVRDNALETIEVIAPDRVELIRSTMAGGGPR